MADSIVQEALEAFGVAESEESENRVAALDDLRFARLGGPWQWPDKIRRQREAEGRPCLTINRMPSFIRQVVNDARQNKPGIMVHPVEKGDVKTAEVISGLIRNIESMSNADIAYDTGVDSAVTGGFGYWRINLDYSADDSFDKDLIIKAMPNPFAVYGDPYSQGADSSDWNTAFVIDNLPKAQFERRFKKAAPIDFSSSAWSSASGWADQAKQTVRIAEYWKRTEVVREIVQYTHMGSGEVGVAYVDEIERLSQQLEGFEVIGTPRPVKSYRVKQYLMNAVELLDEVDWLGRYIPIVPVYGDEVNVEGRRHFRSLIRDARDPQQAFNFWRTMSTELVALAPKAPFIGRKGAFASDPRWATANNATHPFLEYDGPEPPQRQPFNGVPAGDLQMAATASDDMKSVMGLYDASLGARSNETSGRAILARQREGDVSTFHFIDNLSRSIRHTGKILIDLIPKVYNRDRVIRVLGIDGKPQTVRVTAPDGQSVPEQDIYNLSSGKYDLTVKAGPSYTTQREEAATVLTELVRANPQSAAILGDLIVENLDLPGSDKVAKRLQAMLPPEVRQAEAAENPEAVAAQQQIQQMQAALQQLAAKLQDAEQKKDIDARKVAVDEYRAETDRLQALGQSVPLDQLPVLVAQVVMQLMNDPQQLPSDGGEGMLQGMPPMVPMQPEPQGFGQVEVPQPAL